MSKRIAEIQESIAAALNAMPSVFSTVQWGGRAYKVGDSKKFKLLAHVWLSEDGDSVGVAFKLPKPRAEEVIDQSDWIARHSFRTLGSAGWVSADVRTKGQCRALVDLLTESRALYPTAVKEPSPSRSGKPPDASNETLKRIDLVLRQHKATGWLPRQIDEFDD